MLNSPRDPSRTHGWKMIAFVQVAGRRAESGHAFSRRAHVRVRAAHFPTSPITPILPPAGSHSQAGAPTLRPHHTPSLCAYREPCDTLGPHRGPGFVGPGL